MILTKEKVAHNYLSNLEKGNYRGHRQFVYR